MLRLLYLVKAAVLGHFIAPSSGHLVVVTEAADGPMSLVDFCEEEQEGTREPLSTANWRPTPVDTRALPIHKTLPTAVFFCSVRSLKKPSRRVIIGAPWWKF